MTVNDLLTVIGFTITAVSTGVAIGRVVEKLLTKNKNDRQ